MDRLKTTLGTLVLNNPVVVASGTFGTSDEYMPYVDYNQLGGIITKSITVEPKVGNPSPRICETAAGMLNAIGLENKGVRHFVSEIIPFYNSFSTKLIVSIAGESISEYTTLAKTLNKEKRVDALEINISCPNVKKGGVAFIKDVKESRKIVEAVKTNFSRTVIVKISPEAPDMLALTEEIIAGGCDVLSIINTIKGIAVDVSTKRPKLGNVTGGLSGPAIKPIALRYLYEVKQRFDIPVIAGGGIMDIDDALEFLIVGAESISVGTANFINPRASEEIVEGLRIYMENNKIEKLSQLIRTLKI